MPERLPSRRHPAGPAHRGLGVRLRAARGRRPRGDGHHDQVLRDPLGVLLAQGAQLVVDGPVELLAGDSLGDARLGQPRALRRQPRPLPLSRSSAIGREPGRPLDGRPSRTADRPSATVAATAAAPAAAATAASRRGGRPAAAGRTAAPPRRSLLLGHAINSSVSSGARAAPSLVYGCAPDPAGSGNAAPCPDNRERARLNRRALSESMSGGVLLSHTVTSAVPSALKGLASGFGMEPGVSPSL